MKKERREKLTETCVRCGANTIIYAVASTSASASASAFASASISGFHQKKNTQTTKVEAVAFAADCTAQAEVDAVFEAAAAALGGEPNIVVSTIGGGGVGTDGTPRNGGHHPDGTPRTQLFHEESWETSMRILSTTQFSQHHCCRAAARHMIKGERGGSLLLIGSIMADFSHPTSATYSSSKCAVRKLGEVLARELAPRSIRVNVLQPGHIRTAAELASGMSDSSEGKRAQEARIPLRRMGTPADVGAAAAFLCSMQAAYITGSTLSVDGGWTVGMDLRSEGSPM